jgi:hypothetical protein
MVLRTKQFFEKPPFRIRNPTLKAKVSPVEKEIS